MGQLYADVAAAAGSWATVGLFLLGVGGLLAAAKRWATKHVVRPVALVPALVRELDELKTDVAAIKAELRPNGGASMRDSTNRSEKLASAIADRVGVDSEKAVQ